MLRQRLIKLATQALKVNAFLFHLYPHEELPW